MAGVPIPCEFLSPVDIECEGMEVAKGVNRDKRCSFLLDVRIRFVILRIASRLRWTLYLLVNTIEFNVADKRLTGKDNVKRCQRLTQDFRTENVVKAWKEDVLQLYNVMW